MIKKGAQQYKEELEVIYKLFLDQLFKLKQQQDQILFDCSEVLKNKRIKKIKDKLLNL